MDSASLKIGHGRLQHFADFDDWTEALFPYSQLLQYDNSEVAAGRPSLFVTATYQGVKRPVLWTWYGVTSYPYNSPGRPINLKDSRFVSFFVNQYIQPWMQKINRPNVMVLLDNCTFNYGLYGVKDNAGNFISGVTWDYPYAQNQTDFLNSINNFVVQVHQMNPNIKMICNTDAGAPQSDFLASFQNLDGISIESMEYYYQGGDNWWRSQFFNQYTNAAWIGNAGKIGLMIWQMANDTSTAAVRRAYMHYLMVRGDNFFFAPKIGNNEMATSYYLNMKNAIGLPIAPTVVAQEPGRTQGYAVYSRQTSGGIAYLNWSGVTQTITLPAGAQYVNSSGQPVTQISIPDMAGDYVLYAGGALSLTGNQSPVVTITSPANGANFTMPANVTVAANAYDPDGSIARVEFWQGPNKLGEVYSAPYTWTMYNVPAGSYSGTYGITVKAVDNSGAVSTSGTVSITVGSNANQLPVVSLTTPSNGATFAAPATFTMTASAYDPDGSIARVEFWQGPNKLGEGYAAPYTWTVTNAPAFTYTGTYGLFVRAVDNNGAITTSNVVGITVR